MRELVESFEKDCRCPTAEEWRVQAPRHPNDAFSIRCEGCGAHMRGDTE